MVVPSHSDLMGVPLTMTDPTDTRDTGPRAGTPLWAFLAGITVIGFTALLVAVLRLDLGPSTELARTPLFWVLAVLVVIVRRPSGERFPAAVRLRAVDDHAGGARAGHGGRAARGGTRCRRPRGVR